MEILNFKYDDTFDDWKQEFKRGLDVMGIIYNDEMLTNLVSSLDKTITKYLLSLYYKPRSYLSYRKGFLSRVRKHGLDLSIRTNDLLWKYLEYFTDLTDYSKCFDIELYIADVEVATKDIIFVGVKGQDLQVGIPQPIYEKEYVEIRNKLDLVKELVQTDANPKKVKDVIIQIADILDYLIRRLD